MLNVEFEMTTNNDRHGNTAIWTSEDQFDYSSIDLHDSNFPAPCKFLYLVPGYIYIYKYIYFFLYYIS